MNYLFNNGIENTNANYNHCVVECFNVILHIQINHLYAWFWIVFNFIRDKMKQVNEEKYHVGFFLSQIYFSWKKYKRFLKLVTVPQKVFGRKTIFSLRFSFYNWSWWRLMERTSKHANVCVHLQTSINAYVMYLHK